MVKHIGLKTSKLHDTKNPQFSKDGKYKLISKIEVYHNDEGITGLFPFFKSDKDNEIIKEDSFYKDFIMHHKFNIMSSSITKGIVTNHIEIEFKYGEAITQIRGYYDEESKKINALKIKTNFSEYTLGKQSLLNTKSCFLINKQDFFIPGFQTSYITDKNSCYLSYLGVYYEDYDNYQSKYFETSQVSKMTLMVNKAIKKMDNLIFSFSKIAFLIFLTIFPFIYFYSRSQNILGGDINIKNLRNKDFLLKSTQIHTDEFGFTHIKADNMNDAMFTLGFTQARDRLWQIDLTRRLSNGRLSEIFGSKTLKADMFMRQIGLASINAQRTELLKYTKNIEFFNKFIEGVNYYARNFILPPEYFIVNAAWSDFTINDVSAIINMMSFVLSPDWYVEIAYKYLEDGVGKEFADLVFSIKQEDIPFGNETIVTDEELIELGLHKGKKAESKVIDEIDESKINELKKKKESALNLNKEAATNQRLIPENSFEAPVGQGASNSWVISGKYTESGYPILSNDPHLQNSLPNALYATKIYLPDNTISGCAVPGLPMFVFGSTSFGAWGVTSENNDSIDFCEEKIVDDYYFINDQRYPLIKTEETIVVKGEEDYVLELKWTKNGSIITETLKEIAPTYLGLNSNVPLSFRVGWFLNSNTSYDNVFDLFYAKSIKDILKNVKKGSSPLLSLVFASVNGEIGYTRTGLLPLKKSKASNIHTKNFCKGWLEEDQLKGYLEDDKTPRIINPSKGYIVTANNKMVSENFIEDYDGLHIYGRAKRINEMIQQKISKNEKISLKDNLEFLSDVKDVYAERILPKLIEIYERNKKKQYEEFRKHVTKMQEYQQIAQNNPDFVPPKSNYDPPQSLVYMEHLRKWNYTMESDSHLASIYTVLEYNLAINLIQPIPLEIAQGIISTKNIWNFIYSMIEKIHSGKQVELKQCSYLSGSRDCEKYLVKVIDNLAQNIKDEETFYKGNIPAYGEIMQQIHSHRPFHSNPLLKLIFSRKVKSRGNRNTVKTSNERYNNEEGKFTSTLSPAAQFMVDLKDPLEPFIHVGIGNSGNIFSKHYDDRIGFTEKAQLSKFKIHDFASVANLNTLVLNPIN